MNGNPRVSFGLYLENLHPLGADLGRALLDHRKQIELARDVGFRSIVIGQHVLTQPIQMPAPLPHLASIIDISGDMLLCTGVLLLPLFNPVLLAEDLATLDWLSGGRLVVGIGLGYRKDEYRIAEIEPSDRVSRLNEAIAVMGKVWATDGDDRWSHDGKWHHFEGLPGGFPPTQRPHPPFWVAADADAAVARAGRLGASWYINPRAKLDGLVRQLPIYRESLATSGSEAPSIFPIRREAFIAPTEREARQMAVRYLRRQLELYRSWGQYEVMPDADMKEVDFDEDSIPDTYLVGTPDRVIDLIGKYVDALGVDHFVLRVQWPGTPQDLVLRSIEYVGSNLIPAFTR